MVPRGWKLMDASSAHFLLNFTFNLGGVSLSTREGEPQVYPV